MIGKVLSITNNCIGQTIELGCYTKCSTSCSSYSVSTFEWASTVRKNTTYNYSSVSGGKSTCYRSEIKIIDLSIQVVSECTFTRGKLRKQLQRVMTNYECCGDCCPLTIQFEDDDGEIYEFEAKIGTDVVKGDVQGYDIVNEIDYKIERCGNQFINVNEKECCGVLGSIGGFRMPYFCSDGSCRTGSKFINYDGLVCGSYRVEIEAMNLVNPKFHNITTGGYFGYQGTYTGSLEFNTATGQILVNGNDSLAINRTPGSSFKSIQLKPGINELILTADSGEATFCIYYSDNIS